MQPRTNLYLPLCILFSPGTLQHDMFRNSKYIVSIRSSASGKMRSVVPEDGEEVCGLADVVHEVRALDEQEVRHLGAVQRPRLVQRQPPQAHSLGQVFVQHSGACKQIA